MKLKQGITTKVPLSQADPAELAGDLQELIPSALETVAQSADSALTSLYPQMGRKDLRSQRAAKEAATVSAMRRQFTVREPTE